MNKLQYMLSGNPLTAPAMRFLAYVKNDVLAPSFADILVKEKMPEGWKNMKILDLGSGWCEKIKGGRFKGVDITCVDVFKPYLKECRGLGFKTINKDIRSFVKNQGDNSFDIVWAFDILEHLTQKEAIKVIKHLDRIAKHKIIVWIPAGRYPQDADLKGDGNIHQEHKSTWYPKDFEKLGYEVDLLKDYHSDIRSQSEKLMNSKKQIKASQMWAIKKIG